MSALFVLSIVRPDKTAEMHRSMTALQVRNMVHNFLMGLPGIPAETAWQTGVELSESEFGTEITLPEQQVSLRIDSPDFPPNICPCCGTLVRPKDHALAGDPDAYCLGCYPWDRNVPACLPANSAHTETPED